ncbi:hypothetical protein KTQ96_10385 [Prevotella copri]|uniref:hypothetical protein n=1 Tax=Segatella copri TaxID=165179 RepID=UPI001C2BF63F|nr:hypothetical protein [Segatella copri]MBU9908339.1 hypothetical protein [Segatella copri]MBV3373812.1 hypothetical protein [Segatella copri]
MKKNILIAIILCVFNSVAAFAQTEKEYSMIISLQNGSTVTLGHNDIKNITFTGDKINAEGNVVTTIEELKNMIMENYVRNKDQEAKLDMHDDYLRNLEDVTKSTQVRSEENLKRTEENQARTVYLESTIKDLQTMVQDMQAMLEKQNAKISELENKLNEK